jgi:hypothetical protein
MHRDYLEKAAKQAGIAMVDYLRRLIDADRERQK